MSCLDDAPGHLRFNNAQVGSIFREWLSLALYRELDYPAPQATFAWVASNVWGKNVRVPMVLVERYKRKFCTRFPELGDKCENMWEFAGDFAQGNGGPIPIPVDKGGPVPGVGQSIFDDPNNCQFDKCDSTRVKELEQLLVETPPGDGFEQATADYIDWPAFQRFQCLSWVLATGDDALHNSNNVVLAEGADGKFRYLPYSTDISLGQEWYSVVALPGNNRIAQGCQGEDKCWQETIAVCEDVIGKFTALDPIGMLDDVHQKLGDAGMLRSGDEARYDFLHAWFEGRLRDLPTELDSYRDGVSQCPKGQVDCGSGICDFPENCQVCQPPVGKLAEAIGVGEPAPGGGVCPAIQNYAAPE
ncbi:MAG: CotH kinase family protein [Myxococcales bacterium]